MATVMTKEPAKTGLKNEVQALMALIDSFCALLERETDALKQADFKGVDALQAEKKTLASTYNNQVIALSARKAEMETLDLSFREKFIKARTRFTLVLNDNLRALDAARSSAKRLVDRILDTAQKTVVEQNQTHYSAKGHTASWKTATMSLSVDTQL
jgi:hypothetical protein